jgi:flavocytochrome c
MNPTNPQNNFDLIVVGAGSAGMCCAIRAAQRGLKVLAIEKDTIVGGTLHLTAGHMSAGGTKRQAEKGIIDSPENHYNEIMEISENTPDPAVVRLATQLAPHTIDWLQDLGFEFEPNTPTIIYGHAPYKIPRTHWGAGDYAGGKIKTAGISILKVLLPLWEECVAAGNLTVLLNHKMVSLLKTSNTVIGVEAESEDVQKTFFAKNIVLTTGGYASNPEFFKEVTPDAPRLISSARHTSTGDGIIAARAIGAKFRGGDLHNSTLGGIETEPNSGRTDFWSSWARVSNSVDRKPREIYVNEQSVRFMDENEPNPDVREKVVHQQTARRFWLIFDEKALYDEGGNVIPQWTVERTLEEASREKAIWKTESIEELAQKTGLDFETLTETIATYNEAVDKQVDDAFGRTYLKHKISEAPFYAILTYAYSLISFGGLAVNENLEVVDEQNQPIKNLYAAGEILGAGATSGRAFCGGMLITPALSFGKYLGETL